MKPILLSLAGNSENQDQGLVIAEDSRLVLGVADGAGGISGGAEAAVMATEFLHQNAARLVNDQDCVELLHQMDAAVAEDPVAGETTFVVVVVTSSNIFGASIGDSGAWLIPSNGQFINLTGLQQRKPFVGSGNAGPVAFNCASHNGMLLLATDGLLKYTSPERIIATCREQPMDMVAQQLVELVKYPSGSLPDDVTFILAKT